MSKKKESTGILTTAVDSRIIVIGVRENPKSTVIFITNKKPFKSSKDWKARFTRFNKFTMKY